MPVALVALLVAGCNATFTNLSPQTQVRNDKDQYLVEAAMDCSQQSLRWDSIDAKIVVGNKSYPMKPTPLMTNRWEGYVPVPAGQAMVRYHYKFDYQCNAFGKPESNSTESPEYTLRVRDR